MRKVLSLVSTQWVDLYPTLGIAVGTVMQVQNQSPNPMRLSSTNPTLDDSLMFAPYCIADNQQGDAHAWVNASGLISVEW